MQFHFLTEAQTQQLIENGRENAGREHPVDFKPVVRLYCPWGLAIWLLTEIDPDDYTTAFGLCDLGTRLPVLGPVDLTELANMSGPEGQQIARDDSYVPTRKLSTYALIARITPRSKK
jgi:hypothetical protein